MTEGRAELDDALVMVHLRNMFYRGKFRFVLALYVLSLIVIVILVGMIVYLIKNPTEPLFFPADKVGRLIRVIPVQEPNMTTQDVAKWAVEAVEAAYTYDFVNYRKQLQDAQKYFTDYGWRNYMKSLSGSNNFKALTQRKFIQIAKVVEPPKLVVQGMLGGSLGWKFQMPVLVTYLMPPFNDKSKFSNPLILSVTVRRMDPLQSYNGLGIVQIIANIASGTGQNPSL